MARKPGRPKKAGPKRQYLLRHGVRSIVLWRDGSRAVVSVQLEDGSWRRVVAADCRGMFHEQVGFRDIDLVLSEGKRKQDDFDYVLGEEANGARPEI